MHANDTSVMYNTSDILELHQVINTELVNISEWMRVNSLNACRSEFLFISNAKQRKWPWFW